MTGAGGLDLLSAALTGLAFGYAAQRGGFCLTRGLSNFFLFGDRTLLRAYVLALLVASAGTQLLLAAGAIDIAPRPFRWLASPVGGFVFGAGMVLAGGCAAGTWYRLGEGALGTLAVLLGFALGGTAASIGALAPLRRLVQAPAVDAAGTLLPAAAWPWTALLVLVLVGWAAGDRSPPSRRWPWPLTGAVVGVLIAGGRWTSGVDGAPVGITFATNTAHLLTYPLVGYPARVTWGMALVLAVPVGAFLGARASGEFHWRGATGATIARAFAGGLLMGAGSIVAEGCNITHGLTNLAALAPGALAAVPAMALGAWAALRVLHLRTAGGPARAGERGAGPVLRRGAG